MKYKFFTINKIAGTFYDSESRSNTLMVYAMGAPNVPDNGNAVIALTVLKAKIDLFIPDYIGFGRTCGIFTPENCIKTLLVLYDSFTKGVSGVNYYESRKKFFKYKKILFVGKSLGADYVSLLPRYNPKIKNIGVICGSMDQSEQGKIDPEESNESFVNGLSKDFVHLYRGFNSKIWWKHVNDEDGLSPMDNTNFLFKSKVFIAHGKKDVCVHYSKSVNFYEKLIQVNQKNRKNYKLKLYKNGDHGSNTVKKAVGDYIEWVKLKEK